MHDHDLDLVAALAEGAPPEDAGNAAELVESCPICRAEFQMQQQMRAGLRSLPPVELDAAERALLHRRVSAATGDRRRAPATRSWLRLAPVAAALALIVGVAAVLTSQGNHTTSGSVALDSKAAAPGVGSRGETTLTTVASVAGANATAELHTLANAGVPDLGTVDLDELLRRLPSDGVAPAALDSSPSCLAEAQGTVLRVAVATVDGREVVAFLVGGEPEAVETYDPQGCTFVSRTTVP